MIVAEFERIDQESRRRSSRAPVSFEAPVGGDGVSRTLCRVVDLSRHGARLQTYSALPCGTAISLTLPGLKPVGAVVKWADDFSAGCEFSKPLSERSFDKVVALTG